MKLWIIILLQMLLSIVEHYVINFKHINLSFYYSAGHVKNRRYSRVKKEKAAFLIWLM